MTNKILSKIAALIRKLKSFVPYALPVGVSEFETWADDIITLAQLPNNDSLRFALAAMVTNFKPDVSKVSKNYMVRSVRNAAAKQIASNAMWELKEKQKAQERARQLAEAEAAKINSEATDTITVASDGPK